MRKYHRKTGRILAAFLVFILLLLAAYQIPFVKAHLGWRLDNVRTRIKYFFRPPDQAVFLPTQQADLATAVQATLTTIQTASAALTPSSTPTVAAATPLPSPTPTITPTPLPPVVNLPGVVYVDQHNRWNYCGPANLTMALKFWGWEGDRDDVARVIKPGVDDPDLDFIQRGKPDKNVMPYEMVDFVNDNTEYSALMRYGGEMDLLKRLIANGFPVLIEKGYYERDYTGKIAWLGHYLFVTGYDDAAGEFIVQDAYLRPGQNLRSPYDTFWEGWRSFDYLFMVVYPPERENEVLALLGNWADSTWAAAHALEIAERETQTLTGIDAFFAWFNKGTSLVRLQRYAEASLAYDQAFAIYASLGDDDTQRPYRIMWYQTGPYWAYYYAGRYQDVINLANTTLYDTISEPTLEESLYWRALAEYALGETAAAVDDMRQTVYLNKNFSPGWAKLNEWGVSP